MSLEVNALDILGFFSYILSLNMYACLNANTQITGTTVCIYGSKHVLLELFILANEMQLNSMGL